MSDPLISPPAEVGWGSPSGIRHDAADRRRQALPSGVPASNTAGGETMRRFSPILAEQAHSVTLVVRLASEFMRPHARRIALAALLMGLAAASTASRAWLMQPVLDRIFVGRDGSLLWLLGRFGLPRRRRKGLWRFRRAV